MKVFYQRAYRIGEYLQEKIGFEMETNDWIDDLEKTKQGALYAVDTLKKLCDEAHKKLNPEMYSERSFQISPEELNPYPEKLSNEERKIRTEEGLIRDILSSPDLIVLESYHLLAKNNPKLHEAYEKRKNELK